MSYDKAIIIGNITRQPELKHTPSGVIVCEFGIAVNKKRKGENRACFLDVVSFNKTAEFVQKYFCKGSEILIEGEHDYETWDDKDTGKKRSKIKIIANQVNFVGKREDNPQATQQPQPAQEPQSQDKSYPGEHDQRFPVNQESELDPKDDIPF